MFRFRVHYRFLLLPGIIFFIALLLVALPLPQAAGAALPNITSLNPTSAQPYQLVSIKGTGFGAARGTSLVTIGGTEAAGYPTWIDTEIICRVPSLGAGAAEVVVTTSAGASVPVSLTILASGPGWFYQNSGTDVDLRGIDALDSHTCWAVGGSGVILKTVDGGATWISQVSGSLSPLTCVSVVDAYTVWAGGSDGTTLRTIDGGVTWQVMSSYAGFSIKSVAAVDANTCYASGTMAPSSGFIAKTSDAGASWQLQYVSSTLPYMSPLSMVDAVTLWAGAGNFSHTFTITEGAVLRTTDGENWSEVGPANFSVTSVAALDTNTALVSGWISSSPNTYPPMDMPFLIGTYDAGANWPYGDALFYNGVNANSAQSLHYYAPGQAWACVPPLGSLTSPGAFFKTFDSGGSWESQVQYNIISPGISMAVVDRNVAWSVGSGGTIFHTFDGGSGAPVPLIDYISPSAVIQNASVRATINGSGFVNGCVPFLQQAGTVVYGSDVVVSADGTTIQCDFNMNDMPWGSYDVIVNNPDGVSGKLPGGFNVTISCGTGIGGMMLVFGGALGLISVTVKSRRRRASNVM